MGFTYGGKPCQDPKSIAQSLAKDSTYTVMRDWYGVANRFTVPLGDKAGRGLILLKKSDIDDLDFDVSDTAFDLAFSDQFRKLTIPNVWPLRAFCITPGTDDDPNSVFALEIVDDRYYLWQNYTNRAYNVRRAPDKAYINSTTNSGTAWSWDHVGSDLWTDAGFTGSWPGWPFTPDGVPESWHFWQVPSIQAFQAVARRLGCSLRYNPFTTNYDVVQLGATDSSFDNSVASLKSRFVRWDEKWIEPWAPLIPDKVRVIFRRVLAEDTGNPYVVRDLSFPDTDLAGYAQTGTIAQVWDDLLYIDTNGAALDARAAERASDYARIVRYFNPNTTLHYRVVGTADDLFLGPRCTSVTFQDVGEGNYTIVESGSLESIQWGQYLHGVGEMVSEARCVGNDIEETLLTTFGGGGSPLRFN